jgi:predicted amino acid racemase
MMIQNLAGRAEYPKLLIDLASIRANVQNIVSRAGQYGVEIMGVTKGVCADIHIVRAFVEGGIKIFGDSRLKNISKMRRAKIQGLFYPYCCKNSAYEPLQHQAACLFPARSTQTEGTHRGFSPG